MKAAQVIELARKHVGNGAPMQGSAELCLQDAESRLERGRYPEARNLALKALRYSVGIFHPDYKKAIEGSMD